MPVEAFDRMADSLTAALVAGDFKAYRDLMHLPLHIHTRDGTCYDLRDEAALRHDFELYHATIKAHGVTDIFRQILGTTTAGNGDVVIKCLTHILRDATRLVDPFETAFHLHYDALGWRIRRIVSSEGHIAWTLGQTEISGQGQFDDPDTPLNPTSS